ncbi:MAG TPA: SRPBCC family protein [Streptosporangiaceae bacterium]|nr:SRPBCC family protein [Streptosporangiaceae bacterium]
MADTASLGSLENVNGAWRLRFTRHLSHPPERVWRAITERADLKAWFPQRITGEWVTGGTLTFSDPEGRGPDWEGRVLAVDPPSLLEFTWGTDVLRLEITAAPGGCSLTLTDTLDEMGKAARDGAGWHVCLDQLTSHLGGGHEDGAGPNWREVHREYVAAFGPEGSCVGIPAGYEPPQ